MMPTRMNELSDEQLMTRLDGPEVEAALPELSDRYSHTVFGVGLKILGDRSMAEELVQEVFLKVWRSSNTFDPTRGSFSTWLYRVTRSGAAVHWTCTASAAAGSVPYQMETLTWAAQGVRLRVLKRSWASLDCRGRVSRALEVLDAPHREVIDLVYFGGLSQREISLRTGIPLGTVKEQDSEGLREVAHGACARGHPPGEGAVR